MFIIPFLFFLFFFPPIFPFILSSHFFFSPPKPYPLAFAPTTEASLSHYPHPSAGRAIAYLQRRCPPLLGHELCHRRAADLAPASATSNSSSPRRRPPSRSRPPVTSPMVAASPVGLRSLTAASPVDALPRVSPAAHRRCPSQPPGQLSSPSAGL
jgi:hypothetical protein